MLFCEAALIDAPHLPAIVVRFGEVAGIDGERGGLLYLTQECPADRQADLALRAILLMAVRPRDRPPFTGDHWPRASQRRQGRGRSLSCGDCQLRLALSFEAIMRSGIRIRPHAIADFADKIPVRSSGISVYRKAMTVEKSG